MTLEFWFMFPISVLIATVAMSSGVEGATFFAPLFLLALGLPPEIAIGTGLITEVFGFASGVTAYVRRGLIDYRLARSLLVATVPMALLGSWVAGVANPEMLKGVLGVGLFAVAFSFLRPPSADAVARADAASRVAQGRPAESRLVSANGEVFRYSVCNRGEGMLLAGLGATFMGMISTGLGELNAYFLLRRCRVPSEVAVATSVLVVAITALAAAGSHLLRFTREGGAVIDTVLSLVIFTVPGVIIGGQVGAAVASRIPQHALERALGFLFLFVGGLLLVNVAFG
ncbi:MAG: sulfite exporter TauE/SafE family protein [Gemmatimonadota bacterium]